MTEPSKPNRYAGLSGDALMDEEIKECHEIIGNPKLADIHADARGILGTLLWLKEQRAI